MLSSYLGGQPRNCKCTTVLAWVFCNDIAFLWRDKSTGCWTEILRCAAIYFRTGNPHTHTITESLSLRPSIYQETNRSSNSMKRELPRSGQDEWFSPPSAASVWRTASSVWTVHTLLAFLSLSASTCGSFAARKWIKKLPFTATLDTNRLWCSLNKGRGHVTMMSVSFPQIFGAIFTLKDYFGCKRGFSMHSTQQSEIFCLFSLVSPCSHTKHHKRWLWQKKTTKSQHAQPTFPVSFSWASMTMTSVPCSYTICQKSVIVAGTGHCVVITFGQDGIKSPMWLALM